MTKARRFYIAVEVDYFDHPKVMAVGEKLAYRNLRAQAWCHKHRTDGVMTREVALSFVLSPKAAAAMVEAGLWETVEGGWKIHDYLQHQESRAGLDAAANAGRKGAAIRWGNADPNAVPIATQKQSQNQTQTQGTNEEDERALLVLSEGTWWPYEADKDRTLLHELASEYPAVNALKVVRDLRAWSMDNGIGKSPRNRLRNFFRKAEEFRARDARDVVRPIGTPAEQEAELKRKRGLA